MFTTVSSDRKRVFDNNFIHDFLKSFLFRQIFIKATCLLSGDNFSNFFVIGD